MTRVDEACVPFLNHQRRTSRNRAWNRRTTCAARVRSAVSHDSHDACAPRGPCRPNTRNTRTFAWENRPAPFFSHECGEVVRAQNRKSSKSKVVTVDSQPVRNACVFPRPNILQQTNGAARVESNPVSTARRVRQQHPQHFVRAANGATVCHQHAQRARVARRRIELPPVERHCRNGFCNRTRKIWSHSSAVGRVHPELLQGGGSRKQCVFLSEFSLCE